MPCALPARPTRRQPVRPRLLGLSRLPMSEAGTHVGASSRRRRHYSRMTSPPPVPSPNFQREHTPTHTVATLQSAPRPLLPASTDRSDPRTPRRAMRGLPCRLVLHETRSDLRTRPFQSHGRSSTARRTRTGRVKGRAEGWLLAANKQTCLRQIFRKAGANQPGTECSGTSSRSELHAPSCAFARRTRGPPGLPTAPRGTSTLL